MDAFILGAGFSIAVDSLAMPSTDELGERAIRVQQSIHRVRVADHSNICDGLSCDWPLLVGGKVPPPNFEVWLSRLADDQPYLFEPENQRNRALFRELAGVVAMQVEGATTTACDGARPPNWLSALARNWHERRAHVVTFNYDTLIEATIDALEIPIPGKPDERLTYKHVGPGVLPFWAVMWGGLRLQPAETLTYWKLHGSIHWYWDATTRSAESMVEIGLPARWGSGRDPDYNRDQRAPGKEALIIPPVFAKTSFFGNPVVRHLWRKAFEGLRAANRVFVLGYSLPEADLLVRGMLTESIRETDIWLVYCDTEVLERFQDLGCNRIDSDFLGVAHPIPDFAGWYT